MKNNLRNKGFTLIELMVVIVIIAILTAVTAASFSSAKQKSRDAKRISDAGQIQLALEQFFSKCRYYPDTLAIRSSCSGASLESFISNIPKPGPQAGQEEYEYHVSDTKLEYYLLVKLEETNPVVLDGLPSIYSGCDPSATSKVYCVGPK